MQLNIGDLVDVEWMPGELWENCTVVGFTDGKVMCKTPTGWTVFAFERDCKVVP